VHQPTSIEFFLRRFLATSLLWTLAGSPASAQAVVPYLPQQSEREYETISNRLLLDSQLIIRQLQSPERAIPRLTLATQLAPNNFDAWLLLGRLQVITQEYDKGLISLYQAQRLKPNEAEVYFLIGNTYSQQGKYQVAIEALQKGLKIKPDNVPAIFDLGNVYFRLKRYDEAIAQYQLSFTKDTKFWPALTNIGLIHYERGKIDLAIEGWSRAIAIDKNASEAMMAKAVALFGRNRAAEAYELAKEALKSDSRYGTIPYLKENLWGDRLIADTEKFLQTPKMREILTQ
jgi:tetratricopeptide (TPR) repeat protein